MIQCIFKGVRNGVSDISRIFPKGSESQRSRPLPASPPPTAAPVLAVSSMSGWDSGAWRKPSGANNSLLSANGATMKICHGLEHMALCL